jgi:broad specificity phosphatase PhoE
MAREVARARTKRQRGSRYKERVTELVLVRHAETVWNAEERWQGQTDVPLSSRGREEVARVARRFEGASFDRVISSDLSRAYDTALGIANGASIERDPSLREMHLGAWCGLLHREVQERYPEQLLALQRGEPTRIGGDGETVGELSVRVSSALERIARQSPTERVLVVTHGGVIRSVLLDLLGLSGRTRPLIGSRNTAITRVAIERATRTLVSYNDARHLERDEEGERFVGNEGKARLIELLGVARSDALAAPSAHAETRLVIEKRQLVSYAID